MTGCVFDPDSCSSGIVDLLIRNETASGQTNCLNLVFSTQYMFMAGSLCVMIDGVRLPVEQYQENSGKDGFTIVLDPENPNGLSSAPGTYERIAVDYIRDMSASQECVQNY